MARFLALFIGSVSAADKAAHTPTPEESRRWAEGMAAWGAWMEIHAEAVVDPGSPLGPTPRASRDGIRPHENRIVAWVVVEAAGHEAAAEMFRDHPHFAFMPGDSIEIMECLALPGAD